jgi:hypothetical protein
MRSTSIGGSSEVAGGASHVSVSFRTNVILPVGQKISVSDLTGARKSAVAPRVSHQCVCMFNMGLYVRLHTTHM